MTAESKNSDDNECPLCGDSVYQAEAYLAGKALNGHPLSNSNELP